MAGRVSAMNAGMERDEKEELATHAVQFCSVTADDRDSPVMAASALAQRGVSFRGM